MNVGHADHDDNGGLKGCVNVEIVAEFQLE
jgi:hypothetical protein